MTEAATRKGDSGVRQDRLDTTASPTRAEACSMREKVLEAALAIADDEGFEAVSMRRVAERAGVGTMTLYSHIRDKDELLDRMHDVVMAEQHLPEIPEGWREGLVAIALRTRAMFLRHQWLLRSGMRPHLGPNGMVHIEQSLAVAASLSDDMETQVAVMAAVDDFVLGCTTRQLTMSASAKARGDDEVTSLRSKIGEHPVTEQLLAAGKLPNVSAAIDAGLKVNPDHDRFERELNWLLDGIAANLAPGGATATERSD